MGECKDCDSQPCYDCLTNRVYELEVQLAEIKKLVSKWKTGKESVQMGFTSTITQHYSADECADQLHAIIHRENQNGTV